ncbi:MAG: tRNA epoxyqueuosine(34) reductase QueG [Actinobacteria bacterium]|nr:tRNA epoxyqueuosine(34) reductase QueG [Actinomycetota bacterium]
MRVWCLRFVIVKSVESQSSYTQHLSEVGLSAGLHRVGFTTAEPLLRAREALVEREGRGLRDTMQFTYRNPIRSTTPEMALSHARSIVVGARSYFADVQLPVLSEMTDQVFGDVARYAWSDHYASLRDSLTVVAEQLRSDGHEALVFADSNAIVDREVAYLAGLGWFGKNANLLISGAGSWFVLGCIVTTAELTPSATVSDGCGTCRRCIDACPTGAIVEPGVIDAGKCLAWILQKPGIIAHEYREAIGARMYGCDSCQDACPPSMRLAQHEEVASDAQIVVDVLDLLSLSDAEILERYGRWYIAGRDPRWVRRNALVVIGNTASLHNEKAKAVLIAHVQSPDPVLRAHAIWAASRLGMGSSIPLHDEDPDVAAELHRLPGVREQH